MIDELTLLRLVALKGRVSPEAVTTSLDVDSAEGGEQLQEYVSRELFKSTPTGYRITPAGRERCAELLAAERRNVDVTAMQRIYGDFNQHNGELKTIVTDWQTRGPGRPNDHSDSEYDRAVLERLRVLHRQVSPVLDQIIAVAPRLGHYRVRLDRAADAVAAGDHGFLSKPIVDSYHTVWFELHEELIGLAGLTRAEEAEAGRGG